MPIWALASSVRQLRIGSGAPVVVVARLLCMTTTWDFYWPIQSATASDIRSPSGWMLTTGLLVGLQRDTE